MPLKLKFSGATMSRAGGCQVSDKQDAAGRYARAFLALCQNSIADYATGATGETPAFLAASRECHDAGRGVARWRQRLARRRVLRELDYWNRTGGSG